MVLTTTFTLLRQHKACTSGYKTLARHLGGIRAYGANTLVPLSVILNSNGLADTLWSLRAVPEEQAATRDHIARLFIADCTEHVLPLWEARQWPIQRPPSHVGLAVVLDVLWASRWAAQVVAGAAGASGEAAEVRWQTERLAVLLTYHRARPQQEEDDRCTR